MGGGGGTSGGGARGRDPVVIGRAVGRCFPCAQRPRIFAGISRAPRPRHRLCVRERARQGRRIVLYVLLHRHRLACDPCPGRHWRPRGDCPAGAPPRLFGAISRADHGRGPVLALRRRRLDLPVRAHLSAGTERDMKRWHPPSALLLALLALLALLGLTIALAYQRLGALNTPIALAIATTKALVVAAIFMELRERRPLTIAFAAAGFFWLAILLWLAATAFPTRPHFPPPSPPFTMVPTHHPIPVPERVPVPSEPGWPNRRPRVSDP